MKALILGLGLSGMAARELLLEKGYTVDGFDDNVAVDPQVNRILDLNSVKISDYALVVVSPGISKTHPLYKKAVEANVEVIGEIELGARSLNAPSIGITGTNGKTTVTLLVTHVLNFVKKRARALGNVGVALSKELAKNPLKNEIAVIELSSFQLETLQTKCLDAAVILNITPDHLDRYETMQEYARAKINIASSLKMGGKLFIYHTIVKEFETLLKGLTYEVFGENASNHTSVNEEAAFLLCQTFGVTREQFQEALLTFKKPSHRIEFVKEIDGVSYYDDSKGTNIDAVIQAVKCLQGDIILIAGGVDKGFPYTSWIEPFKTKVKCILAIGASAKTIQNQLSSHFPVDVFESIELATLYAKRKAVLGNIVLLSPGCSSYDQFRDYKHRGETFQKIVQTLSNSKQEVDKR